MFGCLVDAHGGNVPLEVMFVRFAGRNVFVRGNHNSHEVTQERKHRRQRVLLKTRVVGWRQHGRQRGRNAFVGGNGNKATQEALCLPLLLPALAGGKVRMLVVAGNAEVPFAVGG